MPGICKVGVTDDVNKRLKSLNASTALPTRFQIYEVFDDLENTELMEQLILNTFADRRINARREFLEIHPEQLCDFVKKNKRKIREEVVDDSLWNKLGINEGEVLYFTDGEKMFRGIKAIVHKGHRVLYKNKPMSLSDAAVKVLNSLFDKKWKAAQGTIYWTYKGKTIRELKDKYGIR